MRVYNNTNLSCAYQILFRVAGPGSILSVLKQRGWASDLSAGNAGGGDEATTAFYFFKFARASEPLDAT